MAGDRGLPSAAHREPSQLFALETMRGQQPPSEEEIPAFAFFSPFLFCFSLKQGLKERNRAFCQHCLRAFHMYTPRQENRKAFPKWHFDFRCALLNHPTHLRAPWKQAQQVQHRKLMACLYRTPGKSFLDYLPILEKIITETTKQDTAMHVSLGSNSKPPNQS